jgi:hypothetical protein
MWPMSEVRLMPRRSSYERVGPAPHGGVRPREPSHRGPRVMANQTSTASEGLVVA